MSADNIIVIKREEDGKFRAYHRSMSAYAEGQYDYDGPCRYCDGVDLGCLCEGTGHYTSPEETPIFEADTIEEAIDKYNKWLEDDEFGIVEYGYTFEGLEPNEKTVEAMEEGERGEDIEVDTVEELMDKFKKEEDPSIIQHREDLLYKFARLLVNPKNLSLPTWGEEAAKLFIELRSLDEKKYDYFVKSTKSVSFTKEIHSDENVTKEIANDLPKAHISLECLEERILSNGRKQGVVNYPAGIILETVILTCACNEKIFDIIGRSDSKGNITGPNILQGSIDTNGRYDITFVNLDIGNSIYITYDYRYQLPNRDEQREG